MLTPLIFLIYRSRKTSFWTAALLFVAANFILSSGIVGNLAGDNLRKLFSVTFIPWIYMLLLGFLLYNNWSRIEKFIKGQFLLWLVIYAICICASLFFDIGIQGNKIALPWVVLITLLVLSAAFTKPHLSDKILRRNDISYGLYIYHMPIYNFVIYKYGLPSHLVGWLTLLCVPLIALCSLKLVEKPALSLKKYTFWHFRMSLLKKLHRKA